MLMKEFFAYGEKVEGYDVRVLNEREARAGAGILFAFGLMALFNSVTLGHMAFTRVFISFFAFDFLIRVINPAYSPSLLLGRFFVQNQVPEYVGATQKRFAWIIGLMLALPMFYVVVVHPVHNPIKVLVCIVCLLLLIAESAFSICVGCKIYGWFFKEKASHCPGGACEVHFKEPIQTFNSMQKIIAIVTGVGIMIGVYLYMQKLEDKTFLVKKVREMMLSTEEKQALEDAAYAKEEAAFDEEDDF